LHGNQIAIVREFLLAEYSGFREQIRSAALRAWRLLAMGDQGQRL